MRICVCDKFPTPKHSITITYNFHSKAKTWKWKNTKRYSVLLFRFSILGCRWAEKGIEKNESSSVYARVQLEICTILLSFASRFFAYSPKRSDARSGFLSLCLSQQLIKPNFFFSFRFSGEKPSRLNSIMTAFIFNVWPPESGRDQIGTTFTVAKTRHCHGAFLIHTAPVDLCPGPGEGFPCRREELFFLLSLRLFNSLCKLHRRKFALHRENFPELKKDYLETFNFAFIGLIPVCEIFSLARALALSSRSTNYSLNFES